VPGFLYARLKGALLPELRRAWSRDIETSLKDVQRELSKAQAQLAELRRSQDALVVKDWINTRAPLLAGLDARLLLGRVREHILAAVNAATVFDDPTTHAVIDNILPADVYALVSAAIPPEPVFPLRDSVKRDFHIDEHLATAPEFTQRVWRFFDEDVVAGVLAPALHARFQHAVVAHYAETAPGDFGERAAAIPHRGFAGRLHLRRPGYHLKPHLDPKRVVITGLVYFARPGDSEAYGTQLFRVGKSFTSTAMGKFYPDEHGLPVEVVKTVPFRPNTLFAFVNSKAAHGATLPPDARRNWAAFLEGTPKSID
jgi:hypothetical protein